MENKIETQKISKRQIVALILTLSSLLLCCISFVVSNPNDFDKFMENSALWYVAQALMCLAALLPFAGAILAGLSLRAGEGNRTVAIISLVLGILFSLVTIGFLVYVLVFVGVFAVFG